MSLLRREFKIFVDPLAASIGSLVEIKTLQDNLEGYQDPPCNIKIFSPSELVMLYGEDVYPVGSKILPEVKEAFSKSSEVDDNSLKLISTALNVDADVVVFQNDLNVENAHEITSKINMLFGDWGLARKNCEAFVGGHGFPYSFGKHLMNCPFSSFYIMAEPISELMEMLETANGGKVDPGVFELIRSFSLNRHISLCFTRDKLLFYVQQRRASIRNNYEIQDFSFELGYYLNHYYLLLWAGLDQLCWIINGIYELGLRRHEIGFLNHKFLKVLKQKAPKIWQIFKDKDYVQWAKMLGNVRHFAAHRGVASVSDLYFEPEIEISDEEIDREIDGSEEWIELKKSLPVEVLESFRPSQRINTRLQKLEKLPEPIFQTEIDGKECLIYPLLNIEWNFDCFFGLVSKVTDHLVRELKKNK